MVVIAERTLQEIVANIPRLDNLNSQQQFLQASVSDLVELSLQGWVQQPEITIRGEARLMPRTENIEQFIRKNRLDKSVQGILGASSLVHSRILEGCSEATFAVAFMDDRRGSRKKVHSYHEPENKATNVSQIVKDYGWLAPAGFIGGYVPAFLGTKLGYVQPLVSNQAFNEHIQGFVWGMGFVGGGIMLLIAAYRYSKNPTRRYARNRHILGKERITHNEIKLNDDDYGLKPAPGLYSGKQVTYVLSAGEHDGRTLRIKEWLEAQSRALLFGVSISDHAVPHAIGIATLELTIDGQPISVSMGKGFEYQTIEIPTSRINGLDLPTGYVIPAYNFRVARNKSTFHG